MFPLSTRAKEAIKLGLAMVIAYWIAMQLGWEKPFWAALTVATASVLSTGQSLGRATMRALGTAVGARRSSLYRSRPGGEPMERPSAESIRKWSHLVDHRGHRVRRPGARWPARHWR